LLPFVYPKVTQSATLLQTAISLVAGGVGVALVPASLRNLQRTGVIYKDITEPTPEIKIGVVWRSQDLSPILQQFLTVV
jgi:DNA-binding transcriptional LysR family regulator